VTFSALGVVLRRYGAGLRGGQDRGMTTEQLADSAAPAVSPQYPESRRLATMVACGLSVERELADVAQVLARFHADADRGRHISSQASVSNLSARWREQLSELERFAGSVVAPELINRVKGLASQYIDGRAVLFTQRIIDGHIVDGYGDLLIQDIFCMPDGPVLLDCLKSDDLLRYVDCIDDCACLAMDLEFLGRKDLADHFLDCYRRYSGDSAPASLKDFYVAYHAVVEANADRVRFSQGTPGAASDASRHLSLAIEHLVAGAVHLALIGGGPGSGKTELARSLAERVGADVISIDDVQHELEASNSIAGENDILGDGWSAAHSAAAVHDIAMRRAHTRLANGQSVILDGAWSDPRQRRLAGHLAAETRSTLLEIDCVSGIPATTQGVNGDEWVKSHRVDTGRGLLESTNEAEKHWCSTV
jgi:aminoglycoside phosphotransferase family enzyme/predicted kinase